MMHDTETEDFVSGDEQSSSPSPSLSHSVAAISPIPLQSEGGQEYQESESGSDPRNFDDNSVASSNDDNDEDEDTSFSLNPNSSMEQAEAQGIALLRQIFPDESTEELRALHYQHITKHWDESHSNPQVPASPLGRRIFRETPTADNNWEPTTLPDDFLRLPTSVAVRREYTLSNGVTRNRYEFVSDLEQQALQEHFLLGNEGPQAGLTIEYHSFVIDKHPQVGLGLTLSEEARNLKVVGFVNTLPNPSIDSGIHVNDVVFGINGSAFAFSPQQALMKQTIHTIQASPSPVVLHIQRSVVRPVERGTSLLDSTRLEEAASFSSASSMTPIPSPEIHPFAKALTKRGLIRSHKDEKFITQHLQQFTERARQWESQCSFVLDSSTNELEPHFDPNDLPIDMASMVFHPNEHVNPRSYGPSTPPLPHDSPLIPAQYLEAFFGSEKPFAEKDSPARHSNPTSPMYPGRTSLRKQPRISPFHHRTIHIPLYGVRKALSARIVNMFSEADGNRMAYTIWVYDVESGKEWYAPIRYYQDFAELRKATVALAPNIGMEDWEFPKSPGRAGLLFSPKKKETDEPEAVREAKCRQLEHFLRNLCSLVYTSQPLHQHLAEVAIHVQSFLGVESGLAETDLDQELREVPTSGHNHIQWKVRCQLKTSLQRYTWRIFLLNTMRAIVGDFVDTARAQGPKLQDIETIEVRDRLKQRAMVDLGRIQAFLDSLVDLVLEGCGEELQRISQRRDYSLIRELLDDNIYWDRLVRNAVREQVEIEVYVPLRSVVSRLLVNGWRHEDMEVQFKIKELRKRPQGLFRIPEEKISPSHWQSVAAILKRGVGMSTLPCSKLRAIVDAAREISRVYKDEHGRELLGADDFLPIFIFCVVRAEMERPCALCVLLRTLCDRINRIGEVGYFLASFEAAITHIQEIDLSEDREEMLSFLTVPLTEISLSD